MKVGILTYHRSHNFGALLQAIALRSVLERMGHQTTFIDYWPSYHRRMYASFSISWLASCKGLRNKISYLLGCLFNYKYRIRRISVFNSFIMENIGPYVSKLDEKYDIVVHGSDQIWRKQPIINSYNPFYFGKHNIKTLKKVSYAASMGVLPNTEEDKIAVRDYLSNLDVISVRETDLKNMLLSLGYKNVYMDVDPTLLLTRKEWIEMFHLKCNKDRIAVYYKLQDSFDINELQRFAHSLGLTLKVIHCRMEKAHGVNDLFFLDPKQFLEYIYIADIVFTSSFHGLVFSILFHKPFFASFIENAGRASSLLSTLSLSDHLLTPKSLLPDCLEPIDYKKVDKSLKILRNSSLSRLSNI